MKEKLPAILWYASDWLGSNARARMTYIQRDVYLTLLFRSWYEVPAATLPNNEEELAMMAGVSFEEWEKIKAPVLAQFQVDENGRLFNVRMTKEARKVKGRSSAGSAGWTPERRAKQATKAKQITKRTTKQK